MSSDGRTESTWSVWSRRAVSFPVCVLLAVLVLGGAPLWALLTLAADAATGRLRVLPRTRALAFFALYLACEVVGLCGAGGIWLVTLGGRAGGSRRSLSGNAALQRIWTSALFRGALAVFSMRVEVEGQEHARRGPLLLFVRHSSVADAVLAAALVANPNRILLRYVLKRELLWDPCLDVVGRRLPNAFIDRRSPRRQAELEAIARLARGLDASSAALIYPEGTRYGPGKLAAALEKLGEQGRPDLSAIAGDYRTVLPPRLGGPLALLEAAPGVDVVFLEHTGFEGAATFARFWSGALVGQTIRVRLRRVAASAIPSRGRDVWLFEQWREVDRWTSAAPRST